MTEDIDREIMRRVQQEMKRILTDLEMNQQVDEGRKMNQGFASKQQIKPNPSNHQQVPAKTNGIHNLIGDYQCPLEVPENTGNVQNGNNMGTAASGGVPHIEPTMGGSTTYAGTNGAHEYEHKKQCRPEGEDPMSGCSNEFDYGDESTSQNKLYSCKSDAAGQHGE